MKKRNLVWLASIILAAMAFMACEEAGGDELTSFWVNPGTAVTVTISETSGKTILVYGGEYSFKAIVKVGGKPVSPVPTIKWTLSGNTEGSGTTLTETKNTAQLEVGQNETAEHISVSAVATVSGVSGSRTITLYKAGLAPGHNGGGGNSYEIKITSNNNGSVSTNQDNWVEARTEVVLTVSPGNGYKFAGLTVTKEGGGNLNLDDHGHPYVFEMPAANVTVSAVFVAGEAGDPGDLYNVTIADLSHGSVVSVPANAVEGATVTLTVTPDTGYKLPDTGLTVTKVKGGDVIVSGAGPYTFTMPADDVTVTAAFTPITYTVAYDANDGSGTTDPSVHTYDAAKALTANGFSRTGYNFAGWNTDDEGNGTSYGDGDTVTNLSSEDGGGVTLYAQWADSEKSMLTFNGNGGTPVALITENTGTEVSKPADPTRLGYTFAGWYSAETGGTPYSWPHTLDASVTMYAHWTPITYTVAYHANDGSGTTASSTHTYDAAKALTANGFTKTGYAFDGWNNQADGEGEKSYTNQQSVINLSYEQSYTITLYAQWRDATPPDNVTDLIGVPGNEQVTLVWIDPEDEDLATIQITYSPGGNQPVTVGEGEETTTIDGLTNGTAYTFTVRAVDTTGNKSPGVYTGQVKPDDQPTLTSIDVVQLYLGEADDDPVTLKLNFALGWQDLLSAIAVAGKYVALDLSACPMSGSEFDPGTANTGKDKIVDLVLPNAATSVKAGSPSAPTFKHFTVLDSVSGDYVQTIGADAFRDCDTLTTVSFPAAVTICEYAFGNCYALTEVTFPEAASIGVCAFYTCTALTTVSLPAATSIDNQAFRGCSALTTVSLPVAAPTLGYEIFYGITGAQTVTVKVPSGATGYGTVPATYSDSNSAVCWGNGFRGAGWDGSAFIGSNINSDITLTIEVQELQE